MSKISIFLFFLCLSSISLFWWFGDKIIENQSSSEQQSYNEKKQPTDTTQTPTMPTIIIKDALLKESDKQKGYELAVEAKESHFHHTSDTIECQKVSCNILHYGTQIAHIYAEKTFIDRPGKHALFTGLVHGSLKDLSFKGQDIAYNYSTQIVTTDKIMTYTHPLFQFSAQNSFFDINAQTIHMKNGIRSEFSYCAASNNSR